MNKGYPIFEWIPGILITDKDNKTQNEYDEIASIHVDEERYGITINGEEGKALNNRHMNNRRKMSNHQTAKIA